MKNGVRIIDKLALAGALALTVGVTCAEEKKLELADVPAPVKAAIEANSKGDKIEEIEVETEVGKQIYSVELKAADGKERELEIAPDGKLLKTEEGDDDGTSEQDDDSKEVKIDPTTAPEAVQAALKPLLAGARILAMTKETEGGKTVYEAEYKENNLENSIEVTKDGKVLEIEKGIALDTLSSEIKDAAKGKYPQGTLKIAERVEKKAGDKTSSYFELKIQNNGKMHELKLDAAGKVISADEDDD